MAMEKCELETAIPPRPTQRGRARGLLLKSGILLMSSLVLLSAWHKLLPQDWRPRILSDTVDFSKRIQVTRTYNLTIGVRWMALDGGRWRNVFVCNGQSPCPTLVAEEGDELDLHVKNDLPAQLSIHWSGMSHRRFGFWNDGTGGLNQYPILPRGNWTSKFDTTDHWGLNWYADHTGAGVADGVYGMVWVAPSPKRARPYSLIAKDRTELAHIAIAEKDIRHLALWNYDHRATDWKFTKLQGKNAVSDLWCYKSILVNGKGRVFCKDPDFDTIDGQKLDESGCVFQKGFDGHACKPTSADVEIVETNGQQYIMMNLINIGFEHALKFSIDNHKIWIVATDAGFVEPQLVDVVRITNGARATVLVRLDQEPRDYMMRLSSVSRMQNLIGASILRYPAKHYPIIGAPMELPPTNKDTVVCLNPDSSVRDGCKELDRSSVQPYPAKRLPKHPNLTLRWKTGSQKSPGLPIQEYFVNEKPWQLFRAAMKPVFFTDDVNDVEKPIQGGIPMGTVVDLIVQNTINDTIPMYKHGNPTWHLGAKAYEEFKYDSIADAVKGGLDLNVKDPNMDVVHDLPPLGWLAIRWKVDLKGATMFHAVKLRYFALGMSAPILEGMHKSMLSDIPTYAKVQPHVEFEPLNSGVFG